MDTKKIAIAGGIIAAVAVVGFLIWWWMKRTKEADDRRANIEKGLAFNLSAPTVESSKVDLTPPAKGGGKAEPGQGGADVKVIPLDNETAQSAIALRSSIIVSQPSNKRQVYQDAGAGGGLYTGVDQAAAERIKQWSAARFQINPEAVLSYPIATKWEDPQQWDDVKNAVTKLEALKKKTGNFGQMPSLPITGLNVDAAEIFGSPLEYKVQGKLQLWKDYVNGTYEFFKNWQQEIEKLNDAVYWASVESLRAQGWKFQETDPQP